jgi:hypothetical protein
MIVRKKNLISHLHLLGFFFLGSLGPGSDMGSTKDASGSGGVFSKHDTLAIFIFQSFPQTGLAQWNLEALVNLEKPWLSPISIS